MNSEEKDVAWVNWYQSTKQCIDIAAETKQGLETKILEHEVEDVVRRRFDRSVDVSMRLAKNGLG